MILNAIIVENFYLNLVVHKSSDHEITSLDPRWNFSCVLVMYRRDLFVSLAERILKLNTIFWSINCFIWKCYSRYWWWPKNVKRNALKLVLVVFVVKLVFEALICILKNTDTDILNFIIKMCKKWRDNKDKKGTSRIKRACVCNLCSRKLFISDGNAWW